MSDTNHQPPSLDLERHVTEDAHLINDSVRSFAWEGITVTVKDKKTKEPKTILTSVDGVVRRGEMMALMGPSGSGKTTLLNTLAQRKAASGSKSSGTVSVNGIAISLKSLRQISSFVEQEDALIGSLTVRETLNFAARLSLPSSVSRSDRLVRVDSLIDSFGLEKQSHTIIGTPVRKGVSGGQKRRVSVASQLITGPNILFLDEPTSGLDSLASYEVISFLKSFARKYHLIVISSIHQPSASTFELFDKLTLLSHGKTCYCGPVPDMKSYFDNLGFSMPAQTNPAEFILELTNVDFARDKATAMEHIDKIQQAWIRHKEFNAACSLLSEEKGLQSLKVNKQSYASRALIPAVLLHRLVIKIFRDIVTYGIRIIMYTGLAIMMGTVWLRLDNSQQSIQPFINAIFFGSAFMSFMAIAYVPAFLEDRATFVKERDNGLYGAFAFMLSNFLIGLPFLFLISLLFSIIAYWLTSFRSSGTAFIIWVMWLFLDLVAAESLVVFVSAIFPNFVVSLAVVAFANGLWMCVNGFLVPTDTLNVFWRYAFHYIDYQAYVFRGMLVNEFAHRTYTCIPPKSPNGSCSCMYQTSLAPQCLIDGKDVLATYGYKDGNLGKWVGIMVGIIAVYRFLGWAVLFFKKR